MINDEYGFDLKSAQERDNLNYEIQSGIRREKNFNAIEKVEKGPKDISYYMKRRQPTEWIVSSFGARGACVLLAGDKGEGKPPLCVFGRKENLWDKSLNFVALSSNELIVSASRHPLLVMIYTR